MEEIKHRSYVNKKSSGVRGLDGNFFGNILGTIVSKTRAAHYSTNIILMVKHGDGGIMLSRCFSLSRTVALIKVNGIMDLFQ